MLNPLPDTPPADSGEGFGALPVLSNRATDRPTMTLHALGCRLNQSEGGSLLSGFRASGFREVGAGGGRADFCVIHTCAVTAEAEAECRRLIRKTLRENPETFIAVTGCWAQVGVEAIRKIPGVDLIAGTEQTATLPDLIRNLFAERPMVKQSEPLVFHLAPTRKRGDFTVDHYAAFDHATRPNVKIQDGCDFFCSFCIIPFTRGREKSRRLADVVLEASVWAAQGKREIVLTGVNLGQYASGAARLIDLLDALEAVEGLRRIRISSIEPTTVPRELLIRMGQGGKICPYLHLPLQSGSNAILSAMGRRYTREVYADFVGEATALVPHLGLGTDVMVGFPGEGEREFEETVSLLEGLPFSYLHVFPYSERPGTRLTRMNRPAGPAVGAVKKRADTLRRLSARMRRAFYARHVGQAVEVLFEESHAAGEGLGLTPDYMRVKVATNENLAGQIRTVKIEQADGTFAFGSLVPILLPSSFE